MKRLFWLLWLLIGCTTSQAQQVLYTPASDFDLRNGTTAVVGKAAGRIYTFRGDGAGYFLDAWNDSMLPVATVILDFLPQKIYDSYFVVAGDSITMLYQYLDGRDLYLYGAVLDGEGRLLRRPVRLDQKRTGFLGGADYYSYGNADNKRKLMAYSLSDDSRELGVTAVVANSDLSGTRRISTTLKRDGNLLASKPVLTNSGELLIPVRQATGRRDQYDALMIVRFPESARTPELTYLPLAEDVYVEEPFLRTAPQDGKLYLAAFYTNRRNGNPDGILFVGLDPETYTTFRKLQVPFDDRLRAMTGERSLRNAFANQHLRQLIIKNDGGFVAVSEESFVSYRTAYTPGWGYYSFYGPFMGGPQVREYFYNDILAVSVGADGVMEWPAFIRKEQYSQEDGGLFSSYAFLNTGNSLGFLFNNFDRQRSSIGLVQLNDAGNQTPRSFGGDADMPDWVPRSAKQISARELVVPCLMRKKVCFAKVQF
jgi:hypothetical protein